MQKYNLTKEEEINIKKGMYYILIYDITSHKRLPKILKLCRKYLIWVQKSVFEGELTKRQFTSLSREIRKLINKKEDFVICYAFRKKTLTDKILIGIEKNEFTAII